MGIYGYLLVFIGIYGYLWVFDCNTVVPLLFILQLSCWHAFLYVLTRTSGYHGVSCRDMMTSSIHAGLEL